MNRVKLKIKVKKKIVELQDFRVQTNPPNSVKADINCPRLREKIKVAL